MSNNIFNITLNKNWLLLIVFLCCSAIAFALSNVANTARPAHSVVKGIEYFIDADNKHSLSNIRKLDKNAWNNQQQDLSSLGMSDSPHWFKFILSDLESNRSAILEIDYVLLDEISVWFLVGDTLLTHYNTGDTLPFKEREIEHENFLFPIPQTSQTVDVLIRVRSTGLMKMAVNIWKKQEYLAFTSKNSIIVGAFFGLMLAMGVSNFFFFITTRSPTFLVYSGYVIFLALTLSALHGLGYRYLWPNSPWLQQHAIGIFANLTVFLSIIFCDLLLNVKIHSRRLSKLLKLTASTFVLCLVISLFAPIQIFTKVFLMMLIACGVLIFSVGIWLSTKGSGIARFYTLAWTVLFISGFAVSLDNLNIIKFNLPPHYLLMLGAAIETVLLALILAISHNQQRQTLLNAQAELLEKERQTQQTQKEMLALQESATEELEYKVQERTLELEVTLRELSETNRELEEKNTLDALTGIRNRSYFDKKYLAEVRRSRREQTQLSVAMIDIDHFKEVNDKYGHLVGDECIKFVAKTLQNAMKRPSDDACRFGGEEFALVLPSTELAGAMILVEQIRAQIEGSVIEAEDISVNITVSIGVGAATASPGQTEEAILALADQQLYQAKHAGRNNCKGSNLHASN